MCPQFQGPPGNAPPHINIVSVNSVAAQDVHGLLNLPLGLQVALQAWKEGKEGVVFEGRFEGQGRHQLGQPPPVTAACGAHTVGPKHHRRHTITPRHPEPLAALSPRPPTHLHHVVGCGRELDSQLAVAVGGAPVLLPRHVDLCRSGATGRSQAETSTGSARSCAMLRRRGMRAQSLWLWQSRPRLCLASQRAASPPATPSCCPPMPAGPPPCKHAHRSRGRRPTWWPGT
jgi:hypothetical protein